MRNGPLPTVVRNATDALSQDLARQWTLRDLGLLCGCAPRTLQTNFQRFVGTTPLTFLQRARLDEARRKFLSGGPRTRVAEVAAECGFSHLGRFSALYRDRYGNDTVTTEIGRASCRERV